MATSPYKNVSFYGQGPLVSPIQRQYQPSMQMARELIGTGGNTAPVQSPLEGMSRALQGGLGGYMNYATMKAQGDREKQLNSVISKALAGTPAVAANTFADSSGPGGMNDVAVPVASQAAAPATYQSMMDVLTKSGNTDALPFMNQAAMGQFQQQQAMQQDEINRKNALADAITLKKTAGAPTGPTGRAAAGIQYNDEINRLLALYPTVNGKEDPRVTQMKVLAKLALLKDTGGSFQTIDASNPINPIVGPQKTLAPNQTPGHAAAVKTAEGEATAAVKARAEYEAKGIKSKQALDALVGVDELINNSTGSWGGAAFDMVASVFGSAPEGALNVGKLKVVQANLMLSQPRMEGPQSDRDVNLYREAAGQIGDSTVPNKIKLGAVETIRSLHRKYATPDAKGGSGGNTGTSTGGTSQTVLSTAEQQELEALRKQFGKTQ